MDDIKVLGYNSNCAKNGERLLAQAKEAMNQKKISQDKRIYDASKDMASYFVSKKKGRVYSFPGSRCS